MCVLRAPGRRARRRLSQLRPAQSGALGLLAAAAPAGRRPRLHQAADRRLHRALRGVAADDARGVPAARPARPARRRAGRRSSCSAPPGPVPVFGLGHWWTVLSAAWLHGSLLHIFFNLMWVRQLAPPVAELYGAGRMILIWTAGSIVGFLASSAAGAFLPALPLLGSRAGFTVGASASIFGLLGALLVYGRRSGHSALRQQVWGWTLAGLLFGFVVPGIDNWAHLGGLGRRRRRWRARSIRCGRSGSTTWWARSPAWSPRWRRSSPRSSSACRSAPASSALDRMNPEPRRRAVVRASSAPASPLPERDRLWLTLILLFGARAVRDPSRVGFGRRQANGRSTSRRSARSCRRCSRAGSAGRGATRRSTATSCPRWR